MEIIAAMIIYTLAEGIKENNTRIDAVQEQVVSLENGFLRLVGKHSALYARHRLDHDTHHAKIDNIKEQLDALNSAEK
tara:strand:+ start:2305 stop:2538 length:234 start_codon:yes stop_codon:yes gene_type:complete